MYIQIFTLGRFSLVKNGTPVSFARKARNQPILLAKALISMGGRGVPKETIADALWPDSEGDKALQNLATTLHRLRKLLGKAEVILLERGCLALNQDLCAVDVWQFERLCGNADRFWELGKREHAIETSRRAIDLFKGNFLEEDSQEPWTVVLRERIRSKYMRCVGKLGHYLEEADDLKMAVECYQRSLEIDGMDEEAYRRLMACYFRLGLKSEALSTYRRCKTVLSYGYGLRPSKETEVLKNCIMEAPL
ncbi:hypothetical protein DSCA_47320 [Desulfosarcina alkanivorans]|uniref:Bacterial transcriptional activator domain-containing protein n=1 Tax=Desulfosarcina alkanivorans TaxID=571177 RepID=A0A5K7YM25_9BACT|nr:BTAD domain-containing putative transcriptional regulator [Desulfosarcina alkanivorans]BBO70802.1 hypothetical protein DSCA_47320 [Desulfosarcina alkanivorans]